MIRHIIEALESDDHGEPYRHDGRVARASLGSPKHPDAARPALAMRVAWRDRRDALAREPYLCRRQASFAPLVRYGPLEPPDTEVKRVSIGKTDDWTHRYRVRAHFRLMGSGLDPDEVTRMLRLEPHSAHRSGDRRAGSRCSGLWDEGLWSISSTAAIDPGRPLRNHLSWLLDQLEPVRSEIRRLLEQGNRTDFYIGFTLLTGHGGPELEPDVFARLARLGVPVGFEIHAGP